jgi:hypothetical protein
LFLQVVTAVTGLPVNLTPRATFCLESLGMFAPDVDHLT